SVSTKDVTVKPPVWLEAIPMVTMPLASVVNSPVRVSAPPPLVVLVGDGSVRGFSGAPFTFVKPLEPGLLGPLAAVGSQKELALAGAGGVLVLAVGVSWVCWAVVTLTSTGAWGLPGPDADFTVIW